MTEHMLLHYLSAAATVSIKDITQNHEYEYIYKKKTNMNNMRWVCFAINGCHSSMVCFATQELSNKLMTA